MGKYYVTVTLVTNCDIGHIWSHHTRSHVTVTTCGWGRHIIEITWELCYTATRVKCISSVQNQMGTLSSSLCQLWLGVDLSHHG